MLLTLTVKPNGHLSLRDPSHIGDLEGVLSVAFRKEFGGDAQLAVELVGVAADVTADATIYVRTLNGRRYRVVEDPPPPGDELSATPE